MEALSYLHCESFNSFLSSFATNTNNNEKCWIAAEFVFVFFMYVETKGPTLEELAKVIDGDEADVAHIDIHQVEKEVEIHEHEGKSAA